MAKDSIREQLAELAHDQWSGWMEYLFSKSTYNKDGTVTIPKWAVERWGAQMESSFSGLTEEERDSDRVEADKFLKVFEAFDG